MRPGLAMLLAVASAQDDDDRNRVHHHTTLGNNIGGSVGGVGVVVWLLLVCIIALLIFGGKAKACGPAESKAQVAQSLRWAATFFKVLLAMFIFLALGTSVWLRYYEASDIASYNSADYGLFFECGSCFHFSRDPEPFRSGSSGSYFPLTPDRSDQLKSVVAFMFLGIVATGVALVCRGLSLGREHLRFTPLLIVSEIAAALCYFLAMAVFAGLYGSMTASDHTHSAEPVASEVADDYKLDFSWALVVLAWILATFTAVLACVGKGNGLATVLAYIVLVFAVMALSTTRWVVYTPPAADDDQAFSYHSQLGLFSYCSDCIYYTDFDNLSRDTNGMLDSEHNGERIAAIIFLVFAMLLVQLVLLLALLQGMRKAFYKNNELGKGARAAQPVLLLMISFCVLIALATMGGLYGDVLHYYHESDSQSTGEPSWFFPLGYSYGFAIGAWFATVVAAFLDVFGTSVMGTAEYEDLGTTDSNHSKDERAPLTAGGDKYQTVEAGQSDTPGGYNSLPF
eukprot:m.155422 g.155422  ORF g.155422 m.155422 type:complete len:511 (+) comp20807_c9_seq2:2908-4440(+)